MRFLVTGANGMLGHRVAEAARERGHEVHATDLPDLDLLDGGAVRAALADLRPEVVVNCAAYTLVDRAEEEEELATRINRDTAANLARAASYVVHVSTDYVFDGTATTPYTESSPTNPVNAYGRGKLAGELAVMERGDHHAIVRTAWLFGEGGKNFVDTMLRLGAERDELGVVADQHGSPTWTGHLAPALVELAERRGAGVFHATGGGACTWHDLAAEAIRLAGLDCRVEAIGTEDYPTPAPRPAFSVLETERADGLHLPPWQDGVAGHLKERVTA
jgi:dTDP-4-dehydrorhamnose reductase